MAATIFSARLLGQAVRPLRSSPGVVSYSVYRFLNPSVPVHPLGRPISLSIDGQRRSYTTDHRASKYETIRSNLKDISHSAKRETKDSLGTVVNAVSGTRGVDHPTDSWPKGTTTTTVTPHQASEVVSDLKSLYGLVEAVPRGAVILGVGGLVPYLATSASTVYLARQAFLADRGLAANFDAEVALTLLYHTQNLQVTYGAVILSFLGAIHWGIDFAVRGMQAPRPGQPQGMQRYWLGTLPVLLAWPTLLLPNQLALASQWAAFTVVWYADMMATSWGWTPGWYSTYRFGLTAIVGSCLIVSLAASGYWTLENNEHGSMSQKLQNLRQDQLSHQLNSDDETVGGGRVEGTIDRSDAPIGSVSGGDKAFVRITDVAEMKRKQLNKT